MDQLQKKAEIDPKDESLQEIGVQNKKTKEPQ